MTKAILRWVVPLAALLVLGPLAGYLTISLRAPDGGPETSLLLCSSPVRGVLAGIGAFLLAAVAGCIASRLHGDRAGLFAAGLVLAWGAWGTGRIDHIIRRTGSASTFWALALEAVIVGALGVGLALLIEKVARKPDAHAGPTDGDEPSGLLAQANLLALLFAVVAGAAGAWLIAREPLKGQTFAAAAVAGVLAAGIGRVASLRAPAMLFVLAVGVLAVIGPLAVMAIDFVPTASGVAGDSTLAILPRGAQVVASVRAGVMLPLARPLPLDWIAGAFVGVPMGLNWAAAMVEKHGVEAVGS